MFKKLLIANRGEIAVRVIRACKEMGIESVAVYSEIDRDSLHVKLADHAICIGPADPLKSYLNIPSVIAAAEVSGAEAIHPGYGFLAENADFSEICQANQIVFIGASPANIRLMGNKSQAKKTAKKFKVPILEGSEGVVKSKADLPALVKKIGFPMLIKASHGGGGRGMRIVREESELESQYDLASNEAVACFGNGDVYIEKYIDSPRHVEIQILSDKKGNSIYLGERECSIQRRHQKLIEEAPSPVLNSKIRKKMGEAAVAIAKGIHYEGAGTVEFLMDKNMDFYFMEMNTRIQVEHPVTEAVTGIDLIKEQIRIAHSKKLLIKQKEIKYFGHAIEFRINAEDFENQFMPCPGPIELFLPPGGKGVRIDSYIYPDFKVPPNYDSLLAKLIVWGSDREEALCRARRALSEFIVDGVKTTIPFHQLMVEEPRFIDADFDTHFVETFLNGQE